MPNLTWAFLFVYNLYMAKSRIRVNQKIAKGVYRQTTMNEQEGVIYVVVMAIIKFIGFMLLLPVKLTCELLGSTMKSGTRRRRRR